MTSIEIKKFSPKSDQYCWTFGGVDPVLRLEPHSILHTWTEDAFSGKITSDKDLPSKVLEPYSTNPQTGPFYVEGAEPGDTLAIHFISIRPSRNWAVSTTIPLFGSLSTTKYTPLLHDTLPEKVWMYKVNEEKNSVTFQASDSNFQTDIPMHPFHGTVGVAPAGSEVRSSLVPEAFGGNMDSPEVCEGSTLFLGVNVKGALFSLGDGHYVQGQGEVCGVAVEGAMETEIGIELIKNRYVEWPVIENDDYIMTVGSYRPLEDAFRIAQTQMIKCLASNYGLSIMDAYQLVSQVNETPIANVVDPNYTVVTKVHKKFLPRGHNFMGGAHNNLRKISNDYQNG